MIPRSVQAAKRRQRTVLNSGATRQPLAATATERGRERWLASGPEHSPVKSAETELALLTLSDELVASVLGHCSSTGLPYLVVMVPPRCLSLSRALPLAVCLFRYLPFALCRPPTYIPLFPLACFH